MEVFVSEIPKLKKDLDSEKLKSFILKDYINEISKLKQDLMKKGKKS